MKVYLDNEARDGMLSGAKIAHDAIVSTLGPKGKFVIIGDRVTKDGVSVAKQLVSDDPLVFAGMKMISNGSIEVNNKYGDGTTTVTSMCYNIIQNMISKKIVLNNQTMKDIENYKQILFNHIDNRKRKIKNIDDIFNIATVSANNDPSIGKLFAEAYEKANMNGYINIVESYNEESFVKHVPGYLLEMGAAERKFLKSNGKLSLQNACLAFFEKEVTDKQEVLRLIRSHREKNPTKSLIIIGKSFSIDIINLLEYNNNIDPSDTVFVPMRNIFRNSEHDFIMEDLQEISGMVPIQVFKDFDYDQYVGTGIDCDINSGQTIITLSKDHSEYVDSLKEHMEIETSPEIKKQILKRITKFETGIVTILIGARTEYEFKEKKDRVDDAEKACKQVLIDGYIPGGNQEIFKIIYSLNNSVFEVSFDKEINSFISNKELIKVLNNSFTAPFFQILKNANIGNELREEIISQMVSSSLYYDLKNDSYCDFEIQGIIDPVTIVKGTIDKAISIATTFLNTNCAIL